MAGKQLILNHVEMIQGRERKRREEDEMTDGRMGAHCRCSPTLLLRCAALWLFHLVLLLCLLVIFHFIVIFFIVFLDNHIIILLLLSARWLPLAKEKQSRYDRRGLARPQMLVESKFKNDIQTIYNDI
eukprot:gene2335-1467_t